MKVSVIIPCYNSERTITRAINSVVKQSHQNLEIILVDDKSNDSSIEIIESLIQQHHTHQIHLISLNKNEGVGNARNIGIKNSCGDFFAFLDADDYWHPQKLELSLQKFKENPHIDFIFTSYYIYKNETMYEYSPSIKVISLKTLLKNNYIGLSTVVIKLNKHQRSNIYFTNRRKRQDYELWLSLLKKGFKAEYIKKPLTTYHVQKKSLSSNKLPLLQYNFNVIESTLQNKLKSVYYLIWQVTHKVLKTIMLRWSKKQ